MKVLANIKAAKKKIKVIEKKNLINKSKKSEIKTYIKQFNTAVEQNDKETAENLLKKIQKRYNQGETKSTFHKNTVARKISSLNKKLNTI
ncbi:MAG: 30S ribosomal protein S20 [Eubacteriales bacterium]